MDFVVLVGVLVLVFMRVVAVEMVMMGLCVPVVLIMVGLIVPVVILEAMHMRIIVRRSMVGVRIVRVVCVVEVSVVGRRNMGVIWIGMASVERKSVLHLLAEEDL